MKKLLFIPFAFFAYQGVASNDMLAVPTYTRITKSNGGFFGYKYVDQSVGTENAILACANPGFKGCHFADATFNGPLGASDLNTIDGMVMDAIKSGKYPGQLVYNTNFLVVYSYDEKTDNSDWTVYTRDEAKALGYDL